MRSILDNSKAMAFLSFRAGRPSYDWRDVDAQKRIVRARARASGMAWEAAALLSQIDTAPDFCFDTCSQVRLPKWSTGRVGLVGDAAYSASPLSGHGTTIAMVGAYVLAGELAATPDDIAGALTRRLLTAPGGGVTPATVQHLCGSGKERRCRSMLSIPLNCPRCRVSSPMP